MVTRLCALAAAVAAGVVLARWDRYAVMFLRYVPDENDG